MLEVQRVFCGNKLVSLRMSIVNNIVEMDLKSLDICIRHDFLECLYALR